MENIENFIDYCKSHIENEIDGYEGESIYLCDLGWELTRDANASGSLTYSSALAREYLKEWNDEAAEYWDFEQSEYGKHYQNQFDNPEAYMVCMVIHGVNRLIDYAIDELGLGDKWNDKVELTEELIKQIVEKVNEFNESSLF